MRALEILDADPWRLCEVPGIGKSKSGVICAAWKEQRATADVMMFLMEHGISQLFAKKIISLYGESAIAIVSRDPYRLARDLRGIGFISADRIARTMGVADDSPERVRAAILYVLRQGEEKGHCFLTREQIEAELLDLLRIDEGALGLRLEESLEFLGESGIIIPESVEEESGASARAWYPADLHEAESRVAAKLRAMAGSKMPTERERVERWIERYDEVSGTPLSGEQRTAVHEAARHRLFVMTGGPGVGKTTTANAIIRLLCAMGRNVALAAPTGRAAQRLSEVAGVKARTIHRLLEWQPHRHAFNHDEENPLECDVLIVDESSMIDIRLADSLLRALPETAQAIFIGDVDQLPSVGPGSFLRDLIESGAIPFVRLNQIFRQAAGSSIVRAAHAINQGQNPMEFAASGQQGLTRDRDFYFVEADDPLVIRETLTDLVRRVIPEKYGFDPARDIQVLTPMNRGDIGTHGMNETLQQLLNPSEATPREGVPKPGRFRDLPFRVGDKVIQSANNYDLSVFNGDIGFVRAIDGEAKTASVSFGERLVNYKDEALLDLKLAYAITIHKSQGSEFPAVVMPVSTQHFIMLQRNLVYTGLTRAKKLAVFVGTTKALFMAVRNQQSLRRQTLLLARLAAR
jgi:exodeoxyribonuclease V alpha subunit